MTSTIPDIRDYEPSVALIPVQGSAADEGEGVEDSVRRRLPLLDWQALWADETVETWIVEPLLAERRHIALYSAPKCGKSLLCLELAVNVSRGTPVLGATPTRAYRVLYVDFENDPRGDIRERLQAMGYGPGDLGNLCYLSYPNIGGLDSEAGSCELMAAIEEYECEVVIIDTVSRSVSGAENENDTWLSLYKKTGLKLKQAGVAMLRLDHSGKDLSKGMRGGSAKYGDVDAIWRLERVGSGNDTFRLVCDGDNRMPLPTKLVDLTRLTHPVLRHRVDNLGWRAEKEAQIVAIIAAADAAGLPLTAGRGKVAEKARAAGAKASTDLLVEAVRRRQGCPETSGQMPLEGPVLNSGGQVGTGHQSDVISAGQTGIGPVLNSGGQGESGSPEAPVLLSSSLKGGQVPDRNFYEDFPEPTDDDAPPLEEWEL